MRPLTRILFQNLLACSVACVLPLSPMPCVGQTEADPPTVADRIGFTALEQEYGSALPDGSSTRAVLVEAGVPDSAYLPDRDNSALAGKTFSDLGEPLPGQTASVSGHSTTSARNFVGAKTGGGTRTNSSSPGTDNVDVFFADHFFSDGALNNGRGDPATQDYSVSSHSYILRSSSNFGQAEAQSLLQRLDFYVDQNDTTVVVGTSNGQSTNLPIGLVPAYNVIAVGVTDGSHGAGPTTFYGSGRTKVDIVAPAGTTSVATPIVSSVASLLVDAAAGNVEAAHQETIKATLLAGATKDEVENWDRTTTRPLDERFGAGQVNAYHSFKIQEGGQFEGSEEIGATPVGDLGWDYRDSFGSADDVVNVLVGGSNERFYRFEVTDDQYINELSVALSWNIDITDTRSSRFIFDPVSNLVNLDLELFDASGNQVDASLSTVDNVEHLFLQDLEPGFYDLRVSGDGDSDFALAWRLTGESLPGDFNLDQQVDAADIDFFSGNLNKPAVGELKQLDLDGDDEVTFADLELHVATLVQTSAGGFGTTVGDLNLDGVTNVLDDAFTLVSNLGKPGVLGYADGDLNADGTVDVLNDAFRLVESLSEAAEP